MAINISIKAIITFLFLITFSNFCFIFMFLPCIFLLILFIYSHNLSLFSMAVLGSISNVTKVSKYTATELLFTNFVLQILNIYYIFVTSFFFICQKSTKKGWIAPVRSFLIYFIFDLFFNIHNFVGYMLYHLLLLLNVNVVLLNFL